MAAQHLHRHTFAGRAVFLATRMSRPKTNFTDGRQLPAECVAAAGDGILREINSRRINSRYWRRPERRGQLGFSLPPGAEEAGKIRFPHISAIFHSINRRYTMERRRVVITGMGLSPLWEMIFPGPGRPSGTGCAAWAPSPSTTAAPRRSIWPPRSRTLIRL